MESLSILQPFLELPLTPVPAWNTQSVVGHAPIRIGEISLNDFKPILTNAGLRVRANANTPSLVSNIVCIYPVPLLFDVFLSVCQRSQTLGLYVMSSPLSFDDRARGNVQAEFNGGALVCEDVVAVRKDATGAITLEGPLSPTYFAVRTLLYEQFAML